MIDLMRIAEVQLKDGSLHGRLESDALNFQFLHVAAGNADDHVIDQRAAETVQRSGGRRTAGDGHCRAIHLAGHSARERPGELSFRAFDVHLPVSANLDANIGRQFDEFFSDSRHS